MSCDTIFYLISIAVKLRETRRGNYTNTRAILSLRKCHKYRCATGAVATAAGKRQVVSRTGSRRRRSVGRCVCWALEWFPSVEQCSETVLIHQLMWGLTNSVTVKLWMNCEWTGMQWMEVLWGWMREQKRASRIIIIFVVTSQNRQQRQHMLSEQVQWSPVMNSMFQRDIRICLQCLSLIWTLLYPSRICLLLGLNF